MTDLAFAKYLAAKLLNSGEDCCAICAFNKQDGVCDNQMLAEERAEGFPLIYAS